MSKQCLTGLCLLDLSAAFDTIDHSILVERLSSWFGIELSVLDWFSSYLSNRTYTVQVSGCQSSSSSLIFGVPQGSVLGPLLFTLYTTPLSALISSYSVNHQLFADDTQLYTCFSPSDFTTSTESIAVTFNAISDWMASNFLALNPSKTEFILFGTKQQLAKLDNPSLRISEDLSISSASCVRNLGVMFDSHLSFHDHITKISQVCFYHIRDLRRLRSCLSLQTASVIGTALVQSKLDYCNSLLLNLPQLEINRLQFVQNSLARAVYCRSKYCHITPILQSLHWLKINDRIKYKILSLTYKIIVTSEPSYLSELITIKDPGCTRQSKLITLVRPTNSTHLALSQRAFLHAAPKLWNSLPSDFRKPHPDFPKIPSLSYDKFHSSLKEYLFRISYNLPLLIPRI